MNRKLLIPLLMILLLFVVGCKTEYPEIERDENTVVDEFRNYYNSEVLPYFYGTGEFGNFEGQDGIEIAYAKFVNENSAGALVILHGLNETYTKFAELIYDLRDTGFSIYIMEHRGHGNSGRILNSTEQERRKVYVKKFQNYIYDVKTFYDNVVNETAHDKIFFFAHSLGGGIATLYIEQYPDDFDGAVLSSPMLNIKTTHPTPIDESVAYPMVCSMVGLGKGTEYALDMEEPEVIVDSNDPSIFEFELITKSWKRWKVYNEFIEDNQHLIAGGPGVTWGVTNNYAKVSYEATFKARSHCEAAKITIPILLFQSGEDWHVDEDGARKLKERAVNCPSFEVVTFPDAYHESYMERDFIRNVVVERTRGFLNEF